MSSQRIESFSAPCRIGNFSDKQTQQVVDFKGALGMHEWEGATIDWTTAWVEATSGSADVCHVTNHTSFVQGTLITDNHFVDVK
jgi:hypothetical protein